MTPEETKRFVAWLRQQGAEVLAPTNPYELVRFRARSAVHIIYENKRGRITAFGFADECIVAFRRGSRMDMGLTTKPRTWITKMRAALLLRDGNECFYCRTAMDDRDLTIEHLVSRDKGGPDHMDNLALAHHLCNRKADNLPLIEKIKMRAS